MDLGTSSMEREDVWDGDAEDVNKYCKSLRRMRYLFLRENVLFMDNIRFHRPEPHWTPH